MDPKRIELFTDCLQGSLAPLVHASPNFWWTQEGLEPSTSGCKPGAFPVKLLAHKYGSIGETRTLSISGSKPKWSADCLLCHKTFSLKKERGREFGKLFSLKSPSLITKSLSLTRVNFQRTKTTSHNVVIVHSALRQNLWRKIKESNPQPLGWHDFRGRLSTVARYLPNFGAPVRT